MTYFIIAGVVLFVVGMLYLALTNEKIVVSEEHSNQGLVPDDTMTRYLNQVDQVRFDMLEAVKAYYDPGRGRLTSWWQRGKAEGRQRLSDALNNEQISVIQQGALLEQHIRDGLQNEAVFRTFITQNAALLNEIRIKQDLIEQALSRGRTLDTDQQILLAEAQSRIESDKEQRLSNVRVSEHERKTQIDIEKRWSTVKQDLDAADLFDLSEHQLLNKLRDELIQMVRAQARFQDGDDLPIVKERINTRYEKDITTLEKLIDERQRLVLSQDKEEAERTGTNDTESRGHSQAENPANTDEIPPPNPRRLGRPPGTTKRGRA